MHGSAHLSTGYPQALDRVAVFVDSAVRNAPRRSLERHIVRSFMCLIGFCKYDLNTWIISTYDKLQIPWSVRPVLSWMCFVPHMCEPSKYGAWGARAPDCSHMFEHTGGRVRSGSERTSERGLVWTIRGGVGTVELQRVWSPFSWPEQTKRFCNSLDEHILHTYTPCTPKQGVVSLASGPAPLAASSLGRRRLTFDTGICLAV